jgi:hypothetical protein
MSNHSMAYDHPQYVVHQAVNFAAPTAGANAVTAKYIAFQNLTVYGITAAYTASGGTSTYTAWNGTATVTAIGAQTYSVIRIFNTSAAGTAPAVGTATYGPFVLSLYNGTATGTQTNSTATYLANQVELSAGTNTAGTGQIQAGTNTATGGFTVNAGDVLYVVQGTEATATASYALEFSVTPLANVSN